MLPDVQCLKGLAGLDDVFTRYFDLLALHVTLEFFLVLLDLRQSDPKPSCP